MAQRLTIQIEAINRATAPIRRVTEQLRGISAAAGRAGGFGQISGAASLVNQRLGETLAFSRRLGLQLGVIGGAAGFLFKRNFLDVASDFEQLSIQMESLTGSASAAQNAVKWIDKFAVDTPLQLKGVQQGFVRLKAFGLDPMDGTFQALVDQNAKLGGGQQELIGIINAVGQAWAKQKLQGEEILQLVERGVPVWDLLADATGKSTLELQEMSQKGQLTRKTIKLLIEEMGKQSKGAALAQMQTWNGMMSNLGDLWNRFARMVMRSGLFDWMKDRLGVVLDALNQMEASGRLQELAVQFGENLRNAFTALWDAGKGVWSVLSGIGKVIMFVTEPIGGLKTVGIALAALLGGKLLISILALTKAIGTLGLALATTPIGLFAIAIAGATAAIVLAYTEWGRASNIWLKVSNVIGGTIESLKIYFDELMDFIQPVIDGIKKVAEFSPISLGIKAGKAVGNFLGFDSGSEAKPSRNSPASTVQTLTAGGRNSRADVGGTLNIKIDQEGRGRIQEARSNNPNVDFDFDTGPIMVGN